MFRSLEVEYFSLVTPNECAWDLFNGLGNLGCVSMIDAYPDMPHSSRLFANYINRCNECLINIDSILKTSSYLKKMSLKIDPIPVFEKTSNVTQVLLYFDDILKHRVQPGYTLFNEIESEILKCSNSVHLLALNIDRLEETLTLTRQKLNALSLAGQTLGKTFYLRDQNQENIDISFVPRVGIIDKESQILFKKIVFRVTKGYSWLNLQDFDEKHILYVLITQDNSPLIKRKIDKVCEAMAIQTFELPSNQQNYQEIKTIAELTIKDTENLLQMSQLQLVSTIKEIFKVNSTITQCSRLEELRLYVLKEKTLYENLNTLKTQGSLFIGELWVIKSDIDKLERFLFDQNSTSRQIGSLQPKITILKKPTCFKLNQFTQPSQWIVDTYGIPRFQEVNPAYVTCITFPFLFGVMFGDVFHGGCIFLFGLWLMFSHRNENDFKLKSAGSILANFYDVRFFIVLIGFFSMYNGLIYNEYAGLTLNLFGSCYELNSSNQFIQKNGCTYPFGIDPVWQGDINFVNSYKMKLSVIIAYLHMTLGLIFQATNFFHTEQYFLVIFKFLPQLTFFSCFFGYMDFLIVFKWLKNWSSDLSQAPSIITTMIDMVLKFGNVSGPTMWDPNGNQQAQVQFILLIIGIGCVPLMWLAPIIKIKLQNKNIYANKNESLLTQNSIDTSKDGIDIELMDIQTKNSRSFDKSLEISDNSKTSHDDDEVVVHETIETIEFTLGCVSNTASYLRLWALSLAHTELAEVFWDLILSPSIKQGSWVFLIVMYPLWALVTFGILLCMDSLECFLHSLRLHWVEFQNKFYKGDGVPFIQYSFKDSLELPRKE